MTQTTFTDNVLIDGSRDIEQLRIQPNASQLKPLQTWENSDGTTIQVQISKDGYLQMGDDLLGWSTPDALAEAHRDAASTTKPKRGVHSLGKITNLVSDVIAWWVAELELLGSAGVSGLQSALRSKLTHNNSGTSTSAELRAGDFETINQTGASGARVGQATGVRGTASNIPSGANAYLNKAVGVEAGIANAAGGDITEAAGFEVATPTNSGVIGTLYGLRIPDMIQGSVNYAIHTGLGIVRFGDFLELKRPTAVPGTPVTDIIRLYPKADGKLYTKNSSGVETALTTFQKQTEVDFGALGTRSRTFTITDSDVSASSKLNAIHSGEAATGRAQDENEMDTLCLRCVPGAGQFTLYADALLGSVAGKYKVNYSIA